MQNCPKCQSTRVHRSHLRNPIERWRNRLTRKVPFRCATCHWRGWGTEFGPRIERVTGQKFDGPPPDLEEIDRSIDNHPRLG